MRPPRQFAFPEISHREADHLAFPSLGAPFHWLAGTVEHVALGLLLGGLATWAMRRLEIRWTWAAAALGADVLIGPLSGGTDWTLAAAALLATVGVRAAEERSLPLGGKIAGQTARRHGPLDVLGLLVRTAVRRQRLRLGFWFEGQSLLVGYDAEQRPVYLPVQGPTRGTNTLVLGAAGSGKTVSMTWIAVRAIEAGMPGIFLDPKDDPDFCEQIRLVAARAGKELIEWSPDGPTIYNPYADGSASEVADKVLAGERFTEPHYLRQAQRYIGHAVRALRLAGVQVSLAALAEHMDPDRLEALLRELPEGEARAGYDYLDSLTARQRSDLSGVRDRLSILVESDVGRWLDPRTPGARRFDLLGALRSGAVVLFRLRSDQRPLLMQMLGGAIVLDMQTTTAALQGSPLQSIAVIDEFAALAARQIGGLFGRARGAGMSLILGTQEIADMRLPGAEQLLDQVTGNLTSLIAHRQVKPESAEWVSRHSGEVETWRPSISSDGTWRASRDRAFAIEKEEIRALATGQAAVLVFAGSCRGVSIAQMLSAQGLR